MTRYYAATTALFALAAAISHPTPKPRHYKHHPECHSARCAKAADRAYARHHRPPRPTGALMVASFFGGGSGACGGGSWGVASKTLPCGTRLHICAGGCVDATVTDRGPYIAGRELDLTEDVAKAVGPAPWEGGFSLGAGVGTVKVTIR